MVQPQRLDPMIRELNKADLDVEPARYFGESPWRFDNVTEWPIDDSSGTLTRQSYVFQAVYKIGSGQNATYGGIQLRARVHGYTPFPEKYTDILSESAHRAAHLYNSSKQTPAYINGQNVEGTAPGSGYLDGFNVEGVFRNWETEPVSSAEVDTELGVIDWSVEIYEDDSFDHAELAGIAQGLAHPYYVDRRDQDGRDPIHVAPHKWRIDTYDSRPDYYELRPPAHTGARDRYREGAGNGKKVYINGRYVATMDDKGRAWLKKEYARNDGHYYGSDPRKWSRRGLVETDEDATWSALRKGGVLYLTGETEEGVYLTTRRARPPGWKAGDPDSVPEDLEVREGRPDRTFYYLRLRDPSESFDVEARRDEAITWALGKSSPVYDHLLAQSERWEPDLTGDPNHQSWGGGGGR